jgi:hypothetical protein
LHIAQPQQHCRRRTGKTRRPRRHEPCMTQTARLNPGDHVPSAHPRASRHRSPADAGRPTRRGQQALGGHMLFARAGPAARPSGPPRWLRRVRQARDGTGIAAWPGALCAIGAASPGAAPAHRALICAPTRRKTSATADTNKA